MSPREFELYDVVSDPYEMIDLASDPEHQDRVAAMHQKLKGLMAACGESLTPPESAPGKRKGGKKR